MIHAVSAANQHLYARELDQMFQQREASARVPSRHGVDDFDDTLAVYLLRIDSSGAVQESVRLNPSQDGWRASLWPPHPSDELTDGVLRFCEEQGIPPLHPPTNVRANARA